MAVFGVRPRVSRGEVITNFWTQFRALNKKNLRLLILRHWISTLIQAALLPVLLLALTLNINNFGPSSQIYGVGTPRPIQSMRDNIGSQSLVFVRPPHVGPDVDTVIQKASESLTPEQVIKVSAESDLETYCAINYHGVSNCYAIVYFDDSPLTSGLNNTWNYTIRVDPIRTGYSFSVEPSSNDIQTFFFPVQLTLDNAITNSTDIPHEYTYSRQEQHDYDLFLSSMFHSEVIAEYAIVFFISVLPGIFHVVTFITSDRATGMSELIDAMGGSPAARILSYVASFLVVYFPCWIVFGVLYWYFLFPDSNAAIFIFWQLLSCIAILNASVLAATFWKRSRISSIFVCVCFCCLGGGAAVLINRPTVTGTVVFLSLLFPSMNYIFALAHMCRFSLVNLPVDMLATVIPPPSPLELQTFFVPIWAYFLLLGTQILFYPALAVAFESAIHGINTRGRTLAATEDPEMAGEALRISAVSKTYSTWWKQRLGIKEAGKTSALDGLDLVAYKNQILCLLGANGAGKSTTLDILAGVRRQSVGEIDIYAPPSKLGICPQRNVMYNHMSVYEHVKFWSEIKGGQEDRATLDQLIAACDLTLKRDSRAGKLSGGQKRKLQLACMFVGNSTICLMDEVTTGLDPLSRRTIWNIILSERSKRSMVFTTHFLDEGEVLADHIVILSKGQIKCQGSVTELKNKLGGGYHVTVPIDNDVEAIDAPRAIHQDRVVYTTPDSRSAAQLVAQLKASGRSDDISIAGPTIEDVFLNVAQADASSPASDLAKDGSDVDTLIGQLSDGQATSFWQQLRALLRKRITVLPRYWAAAFLALALPIALMPPINVFIGDKFRRPDCTSDGYALTYRVPLAIESTFDPPQISPDTEWYNQTIAEWNAYVKTLKAMPLGPASANASVYKALREDPIGYKYTYQNFYRDWTVIDDFDAYQNYVSDYAVNISNGGVWVGDSTHPATITYEAGGVVDGMEMLNLYTAVRSGIKIQASIGMGVLLNSDGDNYSWGYLIYANFIFAVYPAFFCLYPAFEKTNNIRALQYSNGVRPLPLWVSYFLFDFCFALAVSIAYTVTISVQFPFWWQPAYMFPVCLLYGMTAILTSYIISLKARSQLSAFLWTVAWFVLGYFGLALAFALPQALYDVRDVQKNTDIISYVLNLFFPIGSMFRAMAVGFNTYDIVCRDNRLVTDPGSWWAYGFPITYLALQVIALFLLLIWADSNLLTAIFSRGPLRAKAESDVVMEDLGAVSKEVARVEQSQDDLLRLLHVSKKFGKTLAVDDVSLGLGEGEIVALLGPNGAGKTTIVNMIRAEMTPTSGHIYLRDTDVNLNPRLARKSMGVCPQFDALDLLTTRQHLEFYGRIKGIPDVRGNADLAMQRVGLAPFARKQAGQLSGGNKRKLSLAIALMGNPDVLILDEPSSAMDAVAKRRMWKTLAEIAPGRSVLLTTHSMEEADALATRAAILSQRLLAIGTTQSLRREYANLHHVQLVLRSAPSSADAELSAVEQAVRDAFADVVFEGESLGGQIKFMVPAASREHPDRDAAFLIDWLEAHREELGLQDYSIGAPTLERVFLSVVKDGPAHHVEV